MDQLRQALTRAGFKADVKSRQKMALKQCKCGTILSEDGLCRLCDEVPMPVRNHLLRKERR